MKIGYFSASEFASKDGATSPYGPMNVTDKLITLLNQIRKAFDKPIIINSAYRSPEHNAAVGGVKNSYHTKGLAADIRPESKNRTDKEFKEDLSLLQEICNSINPDGGVGLYDTFCHVDVRGYRARWDYRSKNKR